MYCCIIYKISYLSAPRPLTAAKYRNQKNRKQTSFFIDLGINKHKPTFLSTLADRFVSFIRSAFQTTKSDAEGIFHSLATATTCFPTLRPANSPTSAAGPLSKPSAVSSTYTIFPPFIFGKIISRNLG